MGARDQPPDPVVMDRLAGQRSAGGADLLFVGKVSPHKAPHDLVKMIAVYRRLYDDRVRLHLVGSPVGSRYGEAMERFIGSLGLETSVHITGPVRPGELEAYFRIADAFVLRVPITRGFASPSSRPWPTGSRWSPAAQGPTEAVRSPRPWRTPGSCSTRRTPCASPRPCTGWSPIQNFRERLRSAGRRRATDFALDRSVERMVPAHPPHPGRRAGPRRDRDTIGHGRLAGGRCERRCATALDRGRSLRRSPFPAPLAGASSPRAALLRSPLRRRVLPHASFTSASANAIRPRREVSRASVRAARRPSSRRSRRAAVPGCTTRAVPR